MREREILMSGKTANIRNLVLIGHSGCGKTSLAEALLFTAGATSRLGRVDDGSSVLDYEPEEIKRKITISSAFHHYQWKKHTVYLADTPGDDNFLADARAALHVGDGAVVVIDAVDGVKVGTEKVWQAADHYKLPRLIFINKLDRERADFAMVMKNVKDILEVQAVPLQLPIGKEASFKGVVDLISLKAYTAAAGGKLEAGPIPDDLQDEVAELRGDLMNFAAESDDALIEKFLEEGELTPEEIYRGLKIGVLKGIDPYDILRVMQTNGDNDDISNEDVIAKLREWEKGSPFEIIGAENDWIEIEFKKLPKNLRSFVEDLEDFCPDAVEGGASAEEILVKELQKTRRLYLSWD